MGIKQPFNKRINSVLFQIEWCLLMIIILFQVVRVKDFKRSQPRHVVNVFSHII